MLNSWQSNQVLASMRPSSLAAVAMVASANLPAEIADAFEKARRCSCVHGCVLMFASLKRHKASCVAHFSDIDSSTTLSGEKYLKSFNAAVMP
jgi:hypothetical protein